MFYSLSHFFRASINIWTQNASLNQAIFYFPFLKSIHWKLVRNTNADVFEK